MFHINSGSVDPLRTWAVAAYNVPLSKDPYATAGDEEVAQVIDQLIAWAEKYNRVEVAKLAYQLLGDNPSWQDPTTKRVIDARIELGDKTAWMDLSTLLLMKGGVQSLDPDDEFQLRHAAQKSIEAGTAGARQTYAEACSVIFNSDRTAENATAAIAAWNQFADDASGRRSTPDIHTRQSFDPDTARLISVTKIQQIDETPGVGIAFSANLTMQAKNVEPYLARIVPVSISSYMDEQSEMIYKYMGNLLDAASDHTQKISAAQRVKYIDIASSAIEQYGQAVKTFNQSRHMTSEVASKTISEYLNAIQGFRTETVDALHHGKPLQFWSASLWAERLSYLPTPLYAAISPEGARPSSWTTTDGSTVVQTQSITLF